MKKATKMGKRLPARSEDFHPSDQEYEMAFCYALNRSWALVHRDGLTANATGIAIALGQRRFIATAGHFIKDGHTIEIVRRKGMPAIPSNFAKRCWDNDGDVGLLELSPEQAAAISVFLDKKGFLTSLDQSKRQAVLVSGFPDCLHANRGNNERMVFPANFLSDTLSLSKWPQNIDPPACVGRDVFVTYPEKTESQRNTPQRPFVEGSGTLSATPHPGGFSGAGMWYLHFCRTIEGGVFFSQLKLFAIQHSSMPKSRLLRGTLIEHWLNLVISHYPDLNNIVTDIRNQ